MCAYNSINGDHACENKYTFTDVVKKDWNFKGFVVSDWFGTYSTVKASAAGLDNERPGENFIGDVYKKALEAGTISQAELNEHARCILRAEFAVGLVDNPIKKSVVEGGFATALRIGHRAAEHRSAQEQRSDCRM